MAIADPEQLGPLIRKWRLTRGLSQEQLAERSGLSARAVSDLERGLRAAPRPESVRLLAEGLQLSESQRTQLFDAAWPETGNGTLPIQVERVGLANRPTVSLPATPTPLFGREEIVREIVTMLAEGETAGSGGHQSGVLSGSGYTINNRDCYYRARLIFDGSGGGLQFGKLRVQWSRQVSPAPAVATFADVPPSHQFFRYVEALAASGITAGCGGGNFCPSNPVTRGQMAAFLSIALGLAFP